MEGLWILALIAWVLSMVFRRASPKDGGGESDLPQARRRRPQVVARRRPLPDEPRAGGTAAADWQREIEELLGVRTGPAGGPLGRQSTVRLPEAEDVEDRESLEVEERAARPEPEGDRPAPAVRDQDEEAEAIIRGRLAVAEARLHGRSRADHERFDQVLRAPPEPPVILRRSGRPALRQALIWREILGPPVSLRERGPDRL